MPQLIDHLIEHRVNEKGVKSIHIDHTKIDLFKQYEGEIPDWKPTNKVKPFNQLQICAIDIETTGLDPEKDRVILAGIMNQDGLYMNIQEESESLLLQKYIAAIKSEQWDIVCGYNCFDFDIPFLEKRCAKYGIDFPFVKGKKEKVFKTAQRFSKPTIFTPYYYTGTPYKHDTAIIDLYHQTLAWDFVARTLTSYTLKQAVLQMGLRENARTELSYEEMMQLWEKRDLELFHEYLHYDLEDTMMLCKKLVPPIYYQKLLLDWKLQSISTAGNGWKWNDILMNALEVPKDEFDPQEKEFYQGATTIGNTGLYLNCSKGDVASLYPSIQLYYGVYSSKDKFGKTLAILNYLKTTRLFFKKIAKKKKIVLSDYTPEQQELIQFYSVITPEDADGIQSAFKIFINSCYGVLAAQGIPLNDYEAAATVTAYGRAIFDLMCAKIVEFGGKIVTADTDGVVYSCAKGENEAIYKKVQEAMPPGINLDFEFTVDAVYVPAANPKDLSAGGKRKNYLMFFPGGKVKRKGGTFNSRSFSNLTKDFPIDYLKKYIESPQKAEEYFQELIRKICTRKISNSDICVTRKITKTEKNLVELGLGQPEEKISFLIGTDGNPVLVDKGKYSINYYTQKVIELRADILASVDPY